MKTSVLAEPVLVGRERELEELQSLLNSAVEGKGTTVFISGEAGSGKTRLAREFLGSLRKKERATVLTGWCLSDAAVPYFPFIEAFNAYFASFAEEQLAGLQQPGVRTVGPAQIGTKEREITTWLSGPRPSEKTGRVEPLSPQVWKDQAFDRVAKTLLTISADRPLVLFLEDVQWADSASLALLHYISRVVSNSEKILVLATFRSEEVTADDEGRPHPLEEEMRAMSREDLFSEIRLPNLNQADFSMIAQSMMGGLVQQELVEKLTKEGNGNTLFLVESLRMLVEQKGLVQEEREWRLAVDDFGIPSKIRDIILRRLAVLKYAQRRVLEAASVIGEKFNVELLAAVLNQDNLGVLDTLNFIAQSTSIVSDEGAFYKFDHQRSREVLYEALSLSLKKGYHTRIAERLESAGKDGKLAFADLAYHYTRADNEEKAVKYSLAAGQEALARYSNKEALESFQFVIQKVGNIPERFAEKTVALEGLGDALYANNNFRKARETFEQLAEFEKGKDKLRAIRKAVVAAFYQGDIPKIQELTEIAEAFASADRVEAARVVDHKGRIVGLQLRYDETLRLMKDSIRVYEEEYALPDAAWDLFVMGFLTPQFGEMENGVAAVLRSLALYEELGDVHSQLEAYLYAGHCFGSCGLYEESARWYSKVIEIDSRFKLNDYARLIPAYCNLAGFTLLDDPKKAKEMCLRALEYCKKSETQYIGSVYGVLVCASVVSGDVASGEEYFEKLMNLPANILGNAPTTTHLNLAKALHFASRNQFAEADKCFDKHLAIVKAQMASVAIEMGTRLYYSWILNKKGRLEEAKAMSEQAHALVESAQRKFEHANVHADLMTFTHPEVNQRFEIRLDLVNVSKSQGSIVKVENVVIPELKIIDLSPNCFLNGSWVEFKDGAIKPFEAKTIKLTVKATKPEAFNLKPSVTYINDLGETKTSSTRPFTITVQPAPKKTKVTGKITAGFDPLDNLLLGGIPEGYAIALTSPSTDERELLIKRFVEAGATADEIVFDITQENETAKALAEEYPSNFYLFICNPQAEAMFQASPNVFKLKGVENLTDIDIALAKAFRMLKPTETGPKRICIEIISDILLQHHAVNTRRWLSALLPTLKLKGFTILAVVDPSMHPAEELQAILGIFDGEIRVTEKETPEGAKQTLKIKKLINQKYSDKEIILNKVALSD